MAFFNNDDAALATGCLVDFGSFDRSFRNFQREMDRAMVLFADANRARRLNGNDFESNAVVGHFVPCVDAFETEKEFCVRVDLPGVHKDRVVVEARDNFVTVSGDLPSNFEEEFGQGTHNSNAAKAGKNDKTGASGEDFRMRFFLRERAWGKFRRDVPVPKDADTNNVHARFENGCLRLTMPRRTAGEGARRKVTVA